MTPGLTGWVQVNGRDELEIHVKARYDDEYCMNITLKKDWKCFWISVGNMMKSKGIVEDCIGVIVELEEIREAEVLSAG